MENVTRIIRELRREAMREGDPVAMCEADTLERAVGHVDRCTVCLSQTCRCGDFDDYTLPRELPR